MLETQEGPRRRFCRRRGESRSSHRLSHGRTRIRRREATRTTRSRSCRRTRQRLLRHLGCGRRRRHRDFGAPSPSSAPPIRPAAQVIFIHAHPAGLAHRVSANDPQAICDALNAAATRGQVVTFALTPTPSAASIHQQATPRLASSDRLIADQSADRSIPSVSTPTRHQSLDEIMKTYLASEPVLGSSTPVRHRRRPASFAKTAALLQNPPRLKASSPPRRSASRLLSLPLDLEFKADRSHRSRHPETMRDSSRRPSPRLRCGTRQTSVLAAYPRRRSSMGITGAEGDTSGRQARSFPWR